jgi:hypothetical protein
MSLMSSRRVVRFVPALAVGLAGCIAWAADGRAGHDVEVTSADGARYEGGYASISITEGPVPTVEVSVAGEGETGGWSASFVVSPAALLAQSGRVKLAALPPTEGVGLVAHGNADEPTLASTGLLSFVLDPESRRIRGQAVTPSPRAAATFDAGYVLTCWVRPEALRQGIDGELDPGMELRVPDERFASEFCRRFAGLR